MNHRVTFQQIKAESEAKHETLIWCNTSLGTPHAAVEIKSPS